MYMLGSCCKWIWFFGQENGMRTAKHLPKAKAIGTISFVPKTCAILGCLMGTSHVAPKGVRYLRI